MSNLARFIEQFHLMEMYSVFVLIYIYYTFRTKIPLVNSSAAAQKIIMVRIAAEVQLNQAKPIKVYDLGSGTGGLCLAIGKNFPQLEVIGIELGLPFWFFAVLRSKLGARKNVRFLKKDFWQYDISDGDIILFYLGDVVMPIMADKLAKEAKSGALIISNTFPLPASWEPIERTTVPKGLSKEVIVYRKI